jgi:hypothetical protein
MPEVRPKSTKENDARARRFRLVSDEALLRNGFGEIAGFAQASTDHPLGIEYRREQ